MYKFVTMEGSCGNPYDVGKCEQHANRMRQEGFQLVQVYQTTSASCCGAKSVLVMIFHQGERP
jgi:hypothetical protein